MSKYIVTFMSENEEIEIFECWADSMGSAIDGFSGDGILYIISVVRLS